MPPRLLLAALPALLLLSCTDAPLTLVSNGSSPYRIILHEEPTENEIKAAEVLQRYLEDISGVRLEIGSVDDPEIETEIILGPSRRSDVLAMPLPLGELGPDGFAIRTVGKKLFIVGGHHRGTLYGVYSFLESYLGCRKYSSSVTIVPKQRRIRLQSIDDVQIPANRFRDTHYRDSNDPEYADWHKLDHDVSGGHPDWGLWVHTFNHLVPPDVHYARHPEYYALVNGRRVPTQLCLTNEGVFRVLVDSLRANMARNPEATYWSVSQNDNTQYCECDKCRAIDEEEGSPSGTLIRFVNRVAAEFPNHVISTLAYQYTRKPPLLARPERNVNIMLCSIEANRSIPISEDSTSADFRRDLEGWNEIAGDILLWDYVVQFRNLVSPFPNLHVLQPNIQYLVQNGATAHFQQGNREIGGEFAELRAYLISKLLWNPDIDIDAVMDDFLSGYYGKAARPIRTYIDEQREALLASGERLDIFGHPNQHLTGYLSPAMMDRYTELFDQAEEAVKDEPDFLLRVQQARLPLEYAILEQSKRRYLGEKGLFMPAGETWTETPGIRDRLNRFVDLCVRSGVTRLKEWSTPPEEYRTNFLKVLDRGMQPGLGLGKPVTMLSAPHERYLPDADTMLTDGIRGVDDRAYSWVGWEGVHPELVVDLGSPQTISKISTGFYQWTLDWIFMPTRVEYAVSTDGKTYRTVGTVLNPIPERDEGVFTHDFEVSFAPGTARYVKLKATNILTLPLWHHGAGGKAWVMIDEVRVE